MRAMCRSAFAGLAILAGVGLSLAVSDAFAQGGQIETEAEFAGFSADDATVTVKITKPGKAVKGMEALRKGREATFKVKPEGSVVSRTTVKLQDGRAGKLEDLQTGSRVRIFWVQDKADANARFARSIAVYLSIEDVSEDVD